MTLQAGDIVRLRAGTTAYRASAMYTAISVPAGSYAVVMHQRDNEWAQAAVLRYVKARDDWVPTKVIVSLRDAGRNDTLGAYHGEGARWEKPSAVDLLGMLAGTARVATFRAAQPSERRVEQADKGEQVPLEDLP